MRRNLSKGRHKRFRWETSDYWGEGGGREGGNQLHLQIFFFLQLFQMFNSTLFYSISILLLQYKTQQDGRIKWGSG
jgi:hypothetical protein